MAGRTTPCLTLAVRGGRRRLQISPELLTSHPLRESEACGAGALAAAAPSLVGPNKKRTVLILWKPGGAHPWVPGNNAIQVGDRADHVAHRSPGG